ncbi:DUF3347 domain-containing protein [Chitinophaga pendula]|uniref:DUF3347 domain-containing protein n=1 Tax=Chitinophaga TaxID=79328 RepID=UPI0012FDCB99|nr:MULTISPECIES: DUF3347 domain-containing protein [Chitinophaga]UCJ09305.1 DUF3347 domain-containing protein [Chitinophaga pendula]
MTKIASRCLLALWLMAAIACQQQPAPADNSAADTTILKAPYADVFYDSLQLVIADYYTLSSALVKADTNAANAAALTLRQHLDSLPLGLLQVDSSRLSVIRENTGSISAEVAGLLLEKTLDNKRASFEMISDLLFDLVKTTGIKGKTIYRQYCPMAFNNKGAYWLSDTTEVLNPYFGDKMLHCGEVTDTLHY